MLPSPDDVERAVREAGQDVRVRDAAVRLALFEAEHHADDPLDVPAALHFAFSRHPDTFSHHAGRILRLLLGQVEARLGLKVLATPNELEARLTQRPRDIEEAREWFSGKVMLHGG